MKNNTTKNENTEENSIQKPIIPDLANVDNAKKFLDDLMFDLEGHEHREIVLDGLMMLFGAIADTPTLAEDLQIHLYSHTFHHSDAYMAYFKSIQAGKDYRAQDESAGE